MNGIGIICSGGDCAGMNPAIKRFVEDAYERELKPYFIYEGLEGLIDGKIKEASYEDVAGIIHLGGTVIHSSRSERFYEKEYRKIAFEHLQNNNISKLVVLGGDGTFRAMDIFAKEFNISFVAIPSTIDNDIAHTEYCLGVDTALNVIKDSIDNIRDTASSFKRAFVIETMGRDCGYLALISALTSGAEVCIIPELEYDLESLENRLQKEVDNGRKYIIVIVSEATKQSDNIQSWLENNLNFETRKMILGHIQRGGSPTVYDRLMAFEFVSCAIQRLSTTPANEVVLYKNGTFEFSAIDEVVCCDHEIDPKLLELASTLVR